MHSQLLRKGQVLNECLLGLWFMNPKVAIGVAAHSTLFADDIN